MELLVVVAMVGMTALLAAPFLAGGTARESLDSYAAESVDALREAQSSAMSGRNNARYGVHFQSDRFVVFQGATYSPSDAANRARTFSADASVTAVSLSPGGSCSVQAGTGNCDVHFADHRGVPTESGTITFTDASGATKTVTVNAQGMTDAN